MISGLFFPFDEQILQIAFIASSDFNSSIGSKKKIKTRRLVRDVLRSIIYFTNGLIRLRFYRFSKIERNVNRFLIVLQ